MNLENKEKWRKIIGDTYLLKTKNKRPIKTRDDNRYKFDQIKDDEECALNVVKPLVGIDVDNQLHTELLLELFTKSGLKFLHYKSKNRGGHFIFKSPVELQPYRNKKCYFGFEIEFYPWGNIRSLVIKDTDDWREIVNFETFEDLDTIPEYMISGNNNFEELYGVGEGDARNNKLMSIYGRMINDSNIKSWDTFVLFVSLVNNVLFDVPLNMDELKNTVLNDEKKTAFEEKKLKPKSNNKMTKKSNIVETIHNTGEILYYNGHLHVYDGTIYSTNLNILKHKIKSIDPNLTEKQRTEVVIDITLDMEMRCKELIKEGRKLDIGFNKLATLNKIIDFNDPNKIMFKEFNPDEKVIKQINVMADAKYISGKVESPHYRNIMGFLTDDDDELETYILDLIANVCIWHGNTIQTCVILLGAGDNGKSTFLTMLNAFFGDWNTTNLRIKDLNTRFKNERLVNSMINIRNESDPVEWGSSESLKEIISGERVDAERKFGNPFFFRPKTKIFVASNELYQSKDKTKGFEKRISIIPCKTEFDNIKWFKNDLYTEEFIWNEYGIKETLLAKLLPRIHRLTHLKKIEKIPNIVQRETQKHIYANSTLLDFLLDKNQKTVEDYLNTNKLKRADLLPEIHNKSWIIFYNTYKNYCRDVLEKHPYGQNRVMIELERFYGRKINKIKKQRNKERILILEDSDREPLGDE